MSDYIKVYWPIISFVLVISVAFITQWAIIGVRVSNVETRQDRQSTAITNLQTQVGSITNDISGMKENLSAIKDNVNYIRTRIDSVTTLSK